jgi:hypothetical protein
MADNSKSRTRSNPSWWNFWDQDAPRKVEGPKNMPVFKYEPRKLHPNLTNEQVEAERNVLLDERAKLFGGNPPLFDDIHDLLRDRLDANANIRGDRLDTTTRGDRLDSGRGDRLDKQSSGPRTDDFTTCPKPIARLKDIAPAILEAQQKRRSLGGLR